MSSGTQKLFLARGEFFGNPTFASRASPQSHLITSTRHPHPPTPPRTKTRWLRKALSRCTPPRWPKTATRWPKDALPSRRVGARSPKRLLKALLTLRPPRGALRLRTDAPSRTRSHWLSSRPCWPRCESHASLVSIWSLSPPIVVLTSSLLCAFSPMSPLSHCPVSLVQPRQPQDWWPDVRVVIGAQAGTRSHPRQRRCQGEGWDGRVPRVLDCR
jgi:hypothetical protein